MIEKNKSKREVKIMNVLFKPSWWMQMFLSTLITCCFIVLLKKITNSVNVPVVKDVMENI